ncbi:MAG: hypothetical protein K1X57_11630 [Gemmataceae bacterium]|nr:hypothetical protein [Gemmataceae bacterium]
MSGVKTGMRARDVQAFLMVARKFQVILLVRHTNADSLQYVGLPGFYPKPAAVKAKTADRDPPAEVRFGPGGKTAKSYHVAGLVVHPGFQPNCYVGAKVAKAQDCWDHTMETLSPMLMNKHVNLSDPKSWAEWGVERKGVNAPRWSWKVDVNPESERFGALMLRRDDVPWSYVHGDYDLKDVIVKGFETVNKRDEGKLDGVKNFTPKLPKGLEFETIQQELNNRMGVEMVQHGAEAQFAWHGDEPITVLFPDWTHLILMSAETVQSWYEDLNRKLLGAGKDYRDDVSRRFHFGPSGTFKPGQWPSQSWG